MLPEKKEQPAWVSTRELQSELRSLRWEMRFLIAAAALANLGLAKAWGLPAAQSAYSYITNLF